MNNNVLTHSSDCRLHPIKRVLWVLVPHSHTPVRVHFLHGEENLKPEGLKHLKRSRCSDDLPLVGAATSACSFCGFHGCRCFVHQCITSAHSCSLKPIINSPVPLERRTSTALEVVEFCARIREFHLLITAPFR